MIPLARQKPRQLKKIEGLIRYEEPPAYVYFLCRKKQVIYIGKSRNIYLRLQSHKRTFQPDAVYLIPVPAEQLDTAEHEWIARIRTPYNLVP